MTDNRHVVIPAGEVIEARFSDHTPKFIKPVKQTSNRKVGLKYEEKALKYIDKTLSTQVSIKAIKSQWLWFRSKGDQPGIVRYCQPDCLLIDEWQKKITIVEIKLQHCDQAQKQIRLLYEPVLKFIYPDYEFSALELVHWFDPHVKFVETYYIEPNILQVRPDRFGIHIWSSRHGDIYTALPAQETGSTPPLI